MVASRNKKGVYVMPWCPICRKEYPEGTAECPDCDAVLTDELPEEEEMSEVAVLESKVLAQRFLSYLDYELGEGAVMNELPDGSWQIVIAKEACRKAKRCFEAFYTVEAQEFAKQEAIKAVRSQDSSGEEELSDTEDEDEEQEDTLEYDEAAGRMLKASQTRPVTGSSAYVKKADQEKDLKSTAITFFAVGIAGVIFLIFNLLGYFPMFDSVISNLIFAVMFFGCLGVGVNSLHRAKKAALDAGEEEDMTSRINTWLDEHLTAEHLRETSDPALSDEANFLRKLEYIRERITQEFGELEDTYLDYITEEYYNSHFEEK